MGTIRRITDLQLGSIATSKILSITSSETVFTINTGNRAFEVNNLGTQTVYYGQSNLVANSGGIILANGAKFWDTIIDNFSMYFRVNSGGVSSNIVIHEYAGN